MAAILIIGLLAITCPIWFPILLAALPTILAFLFGTMPGWALLLISACVLKLAF